MIDNTVFIDFNVLIQENIIPFLKIMNQQKYEVIVDKDIYREIENFEGIEDDYQYFQAIELLKYLERKHDLVLIDTKKYLAFENVKAYLNSKNISQISLLSQSTNTVINFKSELEDYDKQVFEYQTDGNLKKWNIDAPIYKNAFYVEHISFELNQSTEDLKYVYSDKFGYLKLIGDPLARGGEGLIFKTYHNMLAKIYFNKYLTYMNFKKIQTMLTKNIHNPFIVWPVDVLYSNGTFVGYLMPEITDTKSIDELRDLGFPGYSIKERFQMGLTFLKQVDYLHDRNIIVGDMKFDNILVRSPYELYFVDTGSFQVDDYPCPVFLKEFTGRDFTTDELKKKLRNVDDEYFPINKILFEMMILKNPFYSKDSIEIDVNAPRVFHYPLDKNEIKEKPTTDQVIWFNLTNNMREYFYYYFKQNKITNLKTWIKELEVFISKI